MRLVMFQYADFSQGSKEAIADVFHFFKSGDY